MHVLSMLSDYDKITGKELDSPCFTVTATQISWEAGSGSHLFAAGAVQQSPSQTSSPVGILSLFVSWTFLLLVLRL